MFAVIFPGQGSQSVGMVKSLYEKFSAVKKIFNRADEVLDYPISKTILEGPEKDLNLTENTQPAIFLVSYSIFSLIKSEFNLNLNKAKYFAGHSLGEYSALACANSINFENAIRLLKLRGKSMQSAVPVGEGGMLVILGKEISEIEKIFKENNLENCEIANDNCPGQVVISGKASSIQNLNIILKKMSIKNISLPVSAPFHCSLMKKATDFMKGEIQKTEFQIPNPNIISNVTALEQNDPEKIKELLIYQIESRVKWRESVDFMIKSNIKKFIEIGPGKVLTGLMKRIDRNVESISINNEDDIKKIKIND
tara:strand:- start:1105 stop:2034 length:930 start_codon:yes stop_codon:yes gene_type:complete